MKEKLIEQSILLFEKQGFNATSIQDIVKKLNVTKGTFYYYFTSKEQLLMEIHDDYITNLLDRQLKIISRSSLSQKEKLIEIIRLLIIDIQDHGSSARVFFRELRHLSEGNVAAIKKVRREFLENVKNVVQEGINQGEFTNTLRGDMVAFGVVGITNWSYNWFNPDGDVTPEELARIYYQMILHGILNE
ncbi:MULTISPECIES: TetR/AcrR family transcriptional regulator [Virgibacillus]|uniref:HTH-type transcriptional repressor KstR2 n=2 Tax=Virgibacillus TaxID=84406 RepID=A0A024QB66_9BACI|nr:MULTISPECIES: TetR/AcrR family transcriptional regulator [Virgibacillus]EQB37310.1 hypothetical protein M948_01875 [Virgibacillus sp. CM-4]MYL40066.1 TetR family transcriptional regulator [Virgibacillus massiliensis]GGJ62409.1 hypothetical protein GCM10007111_25670 [Virgibacillus kapii]CDQ39191.1 HTH-type transcriptional repressor KstR2 [Virgibacillus massiliensis]